MALQDLPLVPSIASYRFGITINDALYIIDVRWNSSADYDPVSKTTRGAWFMDWYTEKEVPIVIGMKIVLGTFLGRRSGEAPFKDGALVAIDTSGDEKEVTFDDLGTRVIVRYIPVDDLILLRGEAGV